MTKCDEIVTVMDVVSTKKTNTIATKKTNTAATNITSIVSISCDSKKVIDCYIILHTVLLAINLDNYYCLLLLCKTKVTM